MPSVDLVRVAKGRGYTAKIKHVGFKDRQASARAAGFLSMIKPFQSTVRPVAFSVVFTPMLTFVQLPDMDFPINSKAEGRVLVPWEYIHYPNITNQDSTSTRCCVYACRNDVLNAVFE